MVTRSLTCHGGWEGWVHGVSAIICMSKLIIVRSMVLYCVCCRNYVYIYIYIYIYLSYTYTMCNTIQKYGFCSYRYRFINLFKLLLYITRVQRNRHWTRP